MTLRRSVWLVLAMRRSGHHAIVNQLCYQLGHVVHLNNCVLGGWRRQARPKAGRLRLYRDGRVVDTGRQSTHACRRALATLGSDAPHLVYSFEDADVDLDYRPFVEPAESITTLCVVRDPYNWLASSLRHGRRGVRDVERRVAGWKRHVALFADPGSYPFGRLIGVDFGRWVASSSYREALSDRLGLAYCDQGREEVVVFGIGSSFDGRSFDGRATQMRVLDRWRSFVDDARFRALVADPDLRELSRRHFDFAPVLDAHGSWRM